MRESRWMRKRPAAIDGVFDAIAQRCLANQVFVHSDYMPRNLMVSEERVARRVDFQDAGDWLIAYDIASLYRDAFISG